MKLRYLLLLSLGLSGCSEPPTSASVGLRGEDDHDHSLHSHGILDVQGLDAEAALPTLSLTVLPDTVAGWNIQLHTEHFRFTPQQVGGPDVAGEGHAHLYVDGIKFARLYSDWYHLKNLTPGQHKIRVTLNANSHATFGDRGQPIAAEVMIEQAKSVRKKNDQELDRENSENAY